MLCFAAQTAGLFAKMIVDLLERDGTVLRTVDFAKNIGRRR